MTGVPPTVLRNQPRLDYVVHGQSGLLLSALTSSSVGQFWLKYKWKTTHFTKRSRCWKAKSIDPLHDKSTFIVRKNVTLRF